MSLLSFAIIGVVTIFVAEVSWRIISEPDAVKQMIDNTKRRLYKK